MGVLAFPFFPKEERKLSRYDGAGLNCAVSAFRFCACESCAMKQTKSSDSSFMEEVLLPKFKISRCKVWPESFEKLSQKKLVWPFVSAMRYFKPFVVTLLFFLSVLIGSAQSVKDTIYYDNYWRICEKPVARYFRVGELVLMPQWHFVDGVKDFYTEGQLEMTGHYLPTGKKDGLFTFYHPNGKLKKTGRFANDTMKGTWSYYDTKGEVYFQVNCENSRAFTPLFIKNPGGDTLLKDGTGRFAFKLLDYPAVFADAMDIMVKGQCRQGKRVGQWTYDVFYNNDWRLAAKENYEAGIFQGGTAVTANGESELQHPAFSSELAMSKLMQTESFAHDIVFGESMSQSHSPQLANFLQRGEVPLLASEAKKFEANRLDYLTLCVAAIGYGRLDTPRLNWHGGSLRSARLNQDAWTLGYCIQTNNLEIVRQSDLFPVEKLKAYNAKISFTVFEDGTTSDVSVKGNFEKDIAVHLAYYLSRLTGLAPRREGGKAVATQQNLYLFTTVNTATYRKHSYIVYRLFLSQKPQEQTDDKFAVADFANAKFDDESQ
jgi:antitoxin component YwqK of YwqJK toxin-antitoxin module